MPSTRCILSKFYIKPQHKTDRLPHGRRCILSKFYIKPQHPFSSTAFCAVVSYRNSTSNHNPPFFRFGKYRLYLIEILHQTTTYDRVVRQQGGCILSKFYIKPQPCRRTVSKSPSCILSKFYIKPQLVAEGSVWTHGCILSKFYIKPQHQSVPRRRIRGCILSKFYIKPQHRLDRFFLFCVVSYRNSTSNHNLVGSVLIFVVLYLIEILHQTTTTQQITATTSGLYLIEILHQTTTSGLILIDKVLLTGCLPL